MLYVDIPTPANLETLAAMRGEACISIYLPTTPQTQHIGQARIALGNLLKIAVAQLEAAGAPKRSVWPIEEQIEDLIEDEDFWSHQANSLALFATPEKLRSFRLANTLTEMVQVADRFHLKPLYRATSVEQHAFVLALAENGVRLVEIFADLPPQDVKVDGMPKDAASAAGTANVNSRSHSRRLGGSEGQNVHLRAFCRKVDEALRPVLAGRPEPLILAATDPLLSMFRTASSHIKLAADAIETSPGSLSAADLSEAARPILTGLHATTIDSARSLFSARENEGRATTQLARAARAATFGAVETLMVDIDVVLPGTIDETTGELTLAAEESATTYGIIDEIARRVIASGGTVMALRKDDIPQGEPLAAILRYAV